MRLIRNAKYSKFPHNLMPQVSMFYEPTEFIVFINRYCPVLLEITFGKYIPSLSSNWYNRCLLLINIFLFFVVNITLNVCVVLFENVKKIFFSILALAAPLVLSFSVFLLAVPFHTYYRITLNFDFINSFSVEGLGAIQYGLYTANPLLLLVSVSALLVALIGAAVIREPKRKS